MNLSRGEFTFALALALAFAFAFAFAFALDFLSFHSAILKNERLICTATVESVRRVDGERECV